MILADVPLLGLIVALAFHPSGPVAVVACAVAGVHFLHGSFKPRVQLLPAYATLPVAVVGVLRGGLFGSTPPALFTAALCACLAAAIVFDWLLPGVQTLPPPPPGGLSTACATLHVQLPLSDFILRVYYPTRPTSAAERLPYLLHGSASTSGLATFMRMPSALFDWLRYTRSPVYLSDPDSAMLATPEEVAEATRGGAGAAARAPPGAPPRDLPVVVFSHGLGGMPDCYVSSVIVDWVSRGYIVFAPEHADGSAAFTAFPDGYRLPYQPLSPEQRKDRSLEYERRHAQVKQRARELSACIDVAEAAAAYVLPPDGSEGDEDSEPRDLLFIKLLLCDRLDLSRGVCAAGHSFGGATCITAAAKDPRIGAVVALDPWMFPLSPFLLQRGLPSTPVLSIVGDGFCVWRENAHALKLLLADGVRAAWQRQPLQEGGAIGGGSAVPEGVGAPTGNGFDKKGELLPRSAARSPAGLPHAGNVLLHLRGAQHQDFNDFAILLGWVGRRMGLMGPVGPRSAWSAIHRAAARFAAAHLRRNPASLSSSRRYEDVIGGDGAVLERDDGPEHTSAPLPLTEEGAAASAQSGAEERAAPRDRGYPDEPGASECR